MSAPRVYRSRFANMTSAINTLADAAIQGASTSAGAVPVPPGVTKLVSVDIDMADDSAALGSVVAEVILSGDLEPSPQQLTAGSMGGQLITGAHALGQHVHYDCDITAKQNGQVSVQVVIHGTDTGTQAIGVTLGFS